ncbi:MAG: DUF1571 domain-containing protein [Bacteroidetes bacterium]|nr:DUF1571 domain-containing protein [Bacteroidota bacterium]
MKLNKHNIIRYLSIITVFTFVLPFSYSFKNQNIKTETTPLKVIIAMLDSIKKIKSYEFSLKAIERVEKGEYLTAESNVKLNMNPKALYFRNEKRKISVMYVAGTNENKALVKAKSLMNTTVSLDPYGNMMRKNQHYTIHQIGYDYFGKTIAIALSKDRENLSKNLKFLPKKTINGKTCIGLMFDDPKFSYTKYTVQKNEDVSSIAAKFNVSEYLLRLKNDLHSFYGDIKVGKVIEIPSNYCKNILLYLDEKTLLPVTISIYDDTGLFENYEFLNVKTNKKFGAEDFGKFYKD